MLQTARQRFLYMLSDFLAVSIGWLLFNIIRYYNLPPQYANVSLGQYLGFPMVLIGQVAFPAMMIALYAISGYYNKVFFKSRLDDILNAAGISMIGTIIIFFTVLFNDKIDDRLGNFEMIVILWVLLSLSAILPRIVLTSITTKKIWRREIAFNSLIVGTSAKATELYQQLQEKYRTMGFRIVGFVNNKPSALKDGLPVYDLADIEAVAKENDISSFIIVPECDDVQHNLSIINQLLPLGKSVYITPDTYHFLTTRPRTAMVAGQVLIDVSKADIPQSTINLKRIGDIIFSSIALVALAPVYAALALVIKANSPGPAIYAQERIGYKKKPFKIYKFRSMYVDSEADGPALSTVDDPRITSVGRVLRKYRLDELPQFWNVLKGDMSIVGPRPERSFYLKQIIERAPYYNLVHQVRPGITSWGMVKYGYASNVDEMLMRLKYDLLYVENVSFAVDLKILFYTINTVITGKGI